MQGLRLCTETHGGVLVGATGMQEYVASEVTKLYAVFSTT